MNPHVKTGPSRWLQVRAVIFGLAVSNFALVWTLDQRMGGIAALVDPWYHPWSYFNEPSRLLVAASLLAMGRAWSDLAAVSLSAYMVIRFIYLFAMWNGSWQWSFLSKYEPYFVSSYESQYLLALVILCIGVFSLMAGILRRNVYPINMGAVCGTLIGGAVYIVLWLRTDSENQALRELQKSGGDIMHVTLAVEWWSFPLIALLAGALGSCLFQRFFRDRKAR